jgi:hypothetical protein
MQQGGNAVIRTAKARAAAAFSTDHPAAPRIAWGASLAIPHLIFWASSGDATDSADGTAQMIAVRINTSPSVAVHPSSHSPAAEQAVIATIRLPVNLADARDTQGGSRLPSRSRDRAIPCIAVEQTGSMGGSMGRLEAASPPISMSEDACVRIVPPMSAATSGLPITVPTAGGFERTTRFQTLTVPPTTDVLATALSRKAPTDDALVATAVLLLLGATRLAWRPRRREAASRSSRSGELWGIGPLWLVALATVLLAAPGTHAVTAITDANIGPAVDAWLTSPTTATTRYGNIADWNTATVSNMANLFYPSDTAQPTFKGDISKWNTVSVSTMYMVCSVPPHARGLITPRRRLKTSSSLCCV